MRFEFATATRIVFGAGAVREVGSLVKEFGNRCLVVTGREPHRAEKLFAALKGQGMPSVPFAMNGEPEVQTIEMGVTLARENKCNLVIGFGGGSAIDSGKAIAAMLTNGGELLDYLE